MHIIQLAVCGDRLPLKKSGITLLVMYITKEIYLRIFGL